MTPPLTAHGEKDCTTITRSITRRLSTAKAAAVVSAPAPGGPSVGRIPASQSITSPPKGISRYRTSSTMAVNRVCCDHPRGFKRRCVSGTASPSSLSESLAGCAASATAVSPAAEAVVVAETATGGRGSRRCCRCCCCRVWSSRHACTMLATANGRSSVTSAGSNDWSAGGRSNEGFCSIGTRLLSGREGGTLGVNATGGTGTDVASGSIRGDRSATGRGGAVCGREGGADGDVVFDDGAVAPVGLASPPSLSCCTCSACRISVPSLASAGAALEASADAANSLRFCCCTASEQPSRMSVSGTHASPARYKPSKTVLVPGAFVARKRSVGVNPMAMPANDESTGSDSVGLITITKNLRTRPTNDDASPSYASGSPPACLTAARATVWLPIDHRHRLVLMLNMNRSVSAYSSDAAFASRTDVSPARPSKTPPSPPPSHHQTPRTAASSAYGNATAFCDTRASVSSGAYSGDTRPICAATRADKYPNVICAGANTNRGHDSITRASSKRAARRVKRRHGSVMSAVT
mmetsp:Transcript_15570/g.48179  ORF Transcript_15570/g.48179 Transcript_15570/m.48179 type:complete len:524 (-) Transcript_15570:270-1841(-)